LFSGCNRPSESGITECTMDQASNGFFNAPILRFTILMHSTDSNRHEGAESVCAYFTSLLERLCVWNSLSYHQTWISHRSFTWCGITAKSSNGPENIQKVEDRKKLFEVAAGATVYLGGACVTLFPILALVAWSVKNNVQDAHNYAANGPLPALSSTICCSDVSTAKSCLTAVAGQHFPPENGQTLFLILSSKFPCLLWKYTRNKMQSS
jgi:hypothetical protein